MGTRGHPGTEVPPLLVTGAQGCCPSLEGFVGDTLSTMWLMWLHTPRWTCSPPASAKASRSPPSALTGRNLHPGLCLWLLCTVAVFGGVGGPHLPPDPRGLTLERRFRADTLTFCRSTERGTLAFDPKPFCLHHVGIWGPSGVVTCLDTENLWCAPGAGAGSWASSNPLGPEAAHRFHGEAAGLNIPRPRSPRQRTPGQGVLCGASRAPWGLSGIPGPCPSMPGAPPPRFSHPVMMTTDDPGATGSSGPSKTPLEALDPPQQESL